MWLPAWLAGVTRGQAKRLKARLKAVKANGGAVVDRSPNGGGLAMTSVPRYDGRILPPSRFASRRRSRHVAFPP